MAAFAKGQIVLFPFPYTDLSNRKLRPCLVISDEMKDDLVLCQITSKKTRKDEYSLELSKKDYLNGSLLVESYVRCNMIFTADKSQIVKKVCDVSSKKYSLAVSLINKMISMN